MAANPRISTPNRRALLFLFWFLSLSGLMAVLTFLIYQFSLPKAEYVEIGKVADFPPSLQPYEIRKEVYVFVVSAGDGLIVLEPLLKREGAYNVRWNTWENAFIDPGKGAQFNLYGEPLKWTNQKLLRYPVKVSGDQVLIDVNRLLDD